MKNSPNGTWLIACEASGAVRDALLARGIDAVSCDLLPTEREGPHIQGDVREQLGKRWAGVIAFPTCTFLTCAAEWAYQDADFDRYPGVGYHQKVKVGTLTGAERRAAREDSIAFVMSIWRANTNRLVIENPVGVLSKVLGRPQTVQPYQVGDDASKRTCFWERGFGAIPILPPHLWHPPRMVNGRPRWGNQTDSGQNKLSPGEDRWFERSRTFPGIANALAERAAGHV